MGSHSVVAISVISVGTTSVAKSVKISMNFSSQRKFHEREARFGQNLERWSTMVCREEGDIPVYISMNNEGEHSASEREDKLLRLSFLRLICVMGKGPGSQGHGEK